MVAHGQETHPGLGRSMITRRRLLEGGLLLGAASLASACGSGPGPTGAAPASSGAPSPQGSPEASGGSAPVPSGGESAPPPTPLPVRDDAIAAENRLAGAPDWDLRRLNGAAQAYLAAASSAPGGALALRASGDGTVDLEWYRLGWYGGAGARLLRVDHGVPLVSQPAPDIDPETGLAEAGWTTVHTTSAPIGVPSGMLLAVLRNRDGKAVASVPLVLRPDPGAARRAPILFVSAAATWQAYNNWAGVSLYENNIGLPIPPTSGRRAAQVSFDRPYRTDGGAGLLRRWEIQFIRWMERHGRDVEYVADLDLEHNPSLVDGRRLVLMAGHPEYWTRPMRARIETAIAQGIHVAFLTGNECYWQVRLWDGPAGPGTRITCYKSPTTDPITATHPELTTCRWREAPLSDPESLMVGEMYMGIVQRVRDWIVAGSDHWLYEGTQLVDGDAIRNLVGQEFDSYFPDSAQPNTAILAKSPVDRRIRPFPGSSVGVHYEPSTHNATVYTASSGATVVGAGTFQWSWAIDGYGERSYNGVVTPLDARVDRMTLNLLDRLGDGPLAP